MNAISERQNALTTKKIYDGSTGITSITCSSPCSTFRQIESHAASARVLDEHFPHARCVGLEVRHSSDAPRWSSAD